jgi:hypothetical protein
VSLLNGKLVQKKSYYHNVSYNWTAVEETNPFPYDSLLLKGYYKMEYYAGLWNTGGFNAYALSCEDPGLSGSPGGIDTLYLITQQHYNDHYSVNDTMNTMIMINHNYADSDDFNERFLTLEDFILGNNMVVRKKEFYIKLMQPPSQAGAYTFKLIFTLNNGSTFQSTTAPVNLFP